jgi:hypothetical protein
MADGGSQFWFLGGRSPGPPNRDSTCGCENHNQFCAASPSYLAVVLAAALRGIQSPAGEGTEISLL